MTIHTILTDLALIDLGGWTHASSGGGSHKLTHRLGNGRLRDDPHRCVRCDDTWARVLKHASGSGAAQRGGVCARAEDMLMALGLLQQRLWVGGWGEG